MTKVNAKVSVIIPCYNNGSTLTRSIHSALDQTLHPVEVVVVDDGSTDASREIARSFGRAVTCIHQPNSGPAAARNLGIRNAKGDFIAFLDADDCWRSEFLNRCCTFLELHPEAIGVSVGLCFHSTPRKSQIGPRSLCTNVLSEPFLIQNFFSFWAEHNHIRTGSCLIRRKTIIEAGYQNANLRIAEDLELWGLLATYGSWGFISEVLWDCYSECAASTQGWLSKYRSRRELCPTLHQWEERILPRLSPADWPGFRRIRGRVAAVLMHNQILGHHYERALETLHASREDLPRNWLTSLMRCAERAGKFGLWIAFQVVKARETQKCLGMSISRSLKHTCNPCDL